MNAINRRAITITNRTIAVMTVTMTDAD